MHTYKVKVSQKPNGKEWEAVISTPNGLFGRDSDPKYPGWIAGEFAKNEKKVRKAAQEWCKGYEGIERWGEAIKRGVPEAEVPMPEYTVEFVN